MTDSTNIAGARPAPYARRSAAESICASRRRMTMLAHPSRGSRR